MAALSRSGTVVAHAPRYRMEGGWRRRRRGFLIFGKGGDPFSWTPNRELQTARETLFEPAPRNHPPIFLTDETKNNILARVNWSHRTQ